ncbi:MAG: hypothetical protein ABI699_01050 [Caldimonas sp.]
MSIARYIREIGRGRDGARSLSQADARDLMEQLLDRSVSDLEIGAFALAMRIKGESVAELAGFLAAANHRCIAMPTAAPTVVLPRMPGAGTSRPSSTRRRFVRRWRDCSRCARWSARWASWAARPATKRPPEEGPGRPQRAR